MKVYKKVRSYLDTKGIKQKSVAEAAGIPTSTFNAIMNGKRKMYAEDLVAVCTVLGVSADFFVSAEDQTS